VVGIAGIILNARNATNGAQSPVVNLATEEKVSDPLDVLSGADIALSIAQMSGLTEAESLAHNVDAESIKKTVVPSGAQSISKPQILHTELKSKGDIKDHVVAEGDTVESIAIKYGINSQSVRWSNNNITSATLKVGDTLKIPPVDGIVYTVKPGDTTAELASTYKSDDARIVAFNDAEIDGLVEGDVIVIPDGEVVPKPSNNFASRFTAVYGGNGYAAGNCTWHTAGRRAAVGKPLPRNLGNAATWVSRAAAAGLATGSEPRLYAAVQTSQSGWGHVGFVEAVNPDGSMVMSEMNYNWRLYALRSKTVSAAEARTYKYVY